LATWRFLTELQRLCGLQRNGADVIFISHFNASSSPHTARGTLEVRQLPSQVNLDEDVALIDPIIDSIVAAITPFDAGANKRAFVATDTSVAFDPKLGNTADYHPIRAGKRGHARMALL